MGGQSKNAYGIKSDLEFFGSIENILEFKYGISKSDSLYPRFKKLVEIMEGVNEEEIKNHYNVYIYNVLPYPPIKKESLTKWLDFF
jgi:hypothetical protein